MLPFLFLHSLFGLHRPPSSCSFICTTCVEARGEFERTFGGSSQLLGNCVRTNEAVSPRIHECEVLRVHQQGRFTSIATFCRTWIEESSMLAQVNSILGMVERFKMNALDSALRDGACHPDSHATRDKSIQSYAVEVRLKPVVSDRITLACRPRERCEVEAARRK